MITIHRMIAFERRSDRTQGIRVVDQAPAAAPLPAGRVPRIARLMALAIQFDRWLREERARDMSELARRACVSQPRMTQIMNLNHLAPDIQEALLHLPRTERGRDPLTERDLRGICAVPSWDIQRKLWHALRVARGKNP